MSSKPKKRRLIIESSDEEENGAGDAKTVENKKSSKKSDRSTSEKKKVKRIANDDDDSGGGNENEFSISDIKKKAKNRAKQLAEGIEEEPSAKNKKTPPSDKKVNSILNYFKPAGGNNKPESTKTESSVVANRKSSDDSTKKHSKEVSDDFTFTVVKSKTTTSVNNDQQMDVDSDEDIVKVDKKKSKEKKRDDKVKENDKHVTKEKNRDTMEKKKEDKKSERRQDEDSSKVSKKTKYDDKSRNESFEEPKASKKDISMSVEAKTVKKEKETPKVMKSPKKPFIPGEALPRIKEEKRFSSLWVDKYKPDSVDKVIGQHGDRSPLKKLVNWLRNWHKNLDKKPGFGKWGNDDGSGFKAALLSGPPGIGKTTSAQLACIELGFNFLEMNASDARNKKSINEHVKELLNNTKMTDFFSSDSKKETGQRLTAKHCLIMDEVDGMAGNEDRGGVSELIQLIKNTKVPIICICNDRGNQKMRSLVNYCFDLRFYKPKVEQIKAYLLKIAFREKLQILPDVVTEIIISSNYDIRQSIHNLALLATAHTKIGGMISRNEKPIKDVKLGPFDAIKKVFAVGEEYASMSFMDKSDLFFCDYSIMPLFVHENYNRINISSKVSSTAKQLKRFCASIDAISFGDMIDREVRTNQNWSLLPMQAAFSTVMPGAFIRSSNGLGMPQFPQFMGKLSTTNKNRRIIGDLLSHMILSVNGNSTALALDYMDPLRNQLVDPLLQGQAGVSTVLDLMENYSMVKEDMDSILAFGLWAGDTDPMKGIDSKTKAALTRAYNKKDFALPYATDRDTQAVSKKGKAANGKAKGKAKKDESSDEEYYEDELAEGLDFY